MNDVALPKAAALDPARYARDTGIAARVAARALARSGTSVRDAALRAIAAAIRDDAAAILAANARNVARARAENRDAAFVDRLALDAAAVMAMADGLAAVAALPDPIGAIDDLRPMPSGIAVGHMRVPLGVVLIIYESRPDVTADAAGLCIKSGNAAILRGGSESLEGNLAIGAAIARGLVAAGLPRDAVQVVGAADRAIVGHLLADDVHIDVVVPRGGKGLIERVARESKVPVLKHLDGVCHVYIDVSADVDMALSIADNAKTQRYSTCNTMETLLVHAGIAPRVLPRLAAIYAAKGVELRGCERSRALVPAMKPAAEDDWSAEYLAPILAVRIVDSLDEAIAHIARYGSQHTDAIVTDSHDAAQRFLREVDSASVMVNASTRLADGFEYGLGAEIGISTNKLHARGPVGLEGLTSRKWIVLGSGQLRER